MSKKFYNKLIRDKIPEVIKSSGGVPKITILDRSKFRGLLKVKMIEEAKELLETQSSEDVLNELSDIEELVKAIAKNYGISNEQVKTYRLKKLKEVGSFDKQLFLEYVEEK